LFRAAVAKLPLQPLLPRKAVAVEYPSQDVWLTTVSAEDRLYFAKSALSGRLRRALLQGRIQQTAVLDLHGLTLESARERLSKFLHGAQYKHTCVRVIHGKSASTQAPLLKNSVNAWLPQYSSVLAFCSAQQRDGGTGAVYVLLQGDETSIMPQAPQ